MNAYWDTNCSPCVAVSLVCSVGLGVGCQDDSTVEDQRLKLLAAIKSKNLDELLQAIDGSKASAKLQVEVAEARRVAQEVAGATGQDLALLAPAKGNTITKLNVRSVVSPYAVLDDLSYKIAKNTGRGLSR